MFTCCASPTHSPRAPYSRIFARKPGQLRRWIQAERALVTLWSRVCPIRGHEHPHPGTDETGLRLPQPRSPHRHGPAHLRRPLPTPTGPKLAHGNVRGSVTSSTQDVLVDLGQHSINGVDVACRLRKCGRSHWGGKSMCPVCPTLTGSISAKHSRKRRQSVVSAYSDTRRGSGRYA